jgi:FkbM family methyltransferase
MTVSSIETRTGEWIWGPVQRGDASIDESAVAHVLLEHDALSTRGTMIDVGAHHGSAFKRFVNEGWRVVAFEPDSVNRAVLEASTEAGWDLTIDDRALSDHPETDVSFFRSEESTGISGLSAFHESHELVDSVDLTTLAEVLVEFGVEHVHFLKIDTEGHDHRVLHGFPWHIDRPDVIVCEFEDAKLTPGSATLQAEYLLELGYNVVISEWHPVVRYGIQHDFRGLWTFEQNDQVTDAGFGNMIALRPDLASSVPAAVATVVKQRGRVTKRAPETPDVEDPSDGTGAPATNSMAHSPIRGRLYWAIGRRFLAVVPGRLRTLISKFPSKLAGFIHWYLTPSGLLLALSLALLSLGFIIHDLYGVAGTFVLAVFIPYRFAREKGIARRQAGAARNAANKAWSGVLRLRKESAELEGRQVEFRTALDATSASIRKADSAVCASDVRITTLDGRSDALSQRSNALSQRSNALEQQVTDGLSSRRDEIQVVATEVRSQTERTDGLAKRLGDFDGRINDLDDGFARGNERLEEVEAGAKDERGESNQPFIRLLDHRAIGEITTYWNRRLGTSVSDLHGVWMQRHLRRCESLCLGRFATTSGDLIVRTMANRAAPGPTARCLEIGTLFGLGGLLAHQVTRPYFEYLETTVIDCFDGYYGSSTLDTPTGLPVTREVFDTNRKLLGIPEDEIRILHGLSQDPAILEQASTSEYDLVVVDGDHTYAGVKNDVDSYGPLLRPGGLLITDDYSSPQWPEITKYVDDELSEHPDYEFLGSWSRTAVFRRRA